MNNVAQYICISFILLLSFSCNNDFVTDELESFVMENSSIIISPEWEIDFYTIYCKESGIRQFTITHFPDWLDISHLTGFFYDGCATLICKANVCKDFSRIGVYKSYMTMLIEGYENQMMIPIAYINEGKPVAEIPSLLTCRYDDTMIRIPIKNIGNGVLLCSVSQHPRWMSEWYSENYLYKTNFFTVYPNGKVDISCNIKAPQPGKIVITTSDKNNPVVEIEIQIDKGDPL